MRRAVLLVSLVAAVVSEAPYSLPRPGPQQQPFAYPSAPAPAPAPRPQPHYHHHHHPAPQQQSSSGYHYQQPSIAPAFVQPAPQPQPQYIPAAQPQYIPAPQPQYIPAPQLQYIPAPQQIYQQPRPQPYYPPAPQPQYIPSAPQQPQPQPIQQLPPSASYGVPQYPIPVQPQPAPEPIRILPAYIPQPQPQPVQVYQPQPEPQVQVFQPQPQIQQQQQQGYFYPQPLPQSFLRNQLSQQPLQSQSVASSTLSSYQADTNQYNTAQAQTHKDALDAATVDRVQNIIRENEHSSARDAGYLSLVSGVSLENAKPSVEITSFIQTSPLSQSSLDDACAPLDLGLEFIDQVALEEKKLYLGGTEGTKQAGNRYDFENDENILYGQPIEIPTLPAKYDTELIIYLRLTSPTTREILKTVPTYMNLCASIADPLREFEQTLHFSLFGNKQPKGEKGVTTARTLLLSETALKDDDLKQYPSGALIRNEIFNGRAMVHLAPFELLQLGHCYLNLTSRDHMQNAVDAFAIFIRGTVEDVLRLDPQYVLNSARTIAMLHIPHEKLNATWTVVKRGRKTVKVEHWELEMYRPLFRFLNGKEIARLNLSNPAILTYIGTHAQLNRHQVGVVASRYMRLNPDWSQPKNLNMMNNLLCGVPMTFMRKISSFVYLQLTHQVFYHIRACDPLQRRFYLAMMTRTDALGKAYSWSARDVARLGLLLAEVDGPDLASVSPEAMSGLTAQVMMEMPATTLQHITDEQMKYLGLKSLTILTKKLTRFRDSQRKDQTRS